LSRLTDGGSAKKLADKFRPKVKHGGQEAAALNIIKINKTKQVYADNRINISPTNESTFS
jgi:hypothetical protein